MSPVPSDAEQELSFMILAFHLDHLSNQETSLIRIHDYPANNKYLFEHCLKIPQVFHRFYQGHKQQHMMDHIIEYFRERGREKDEEGLDISHPQIHLVR
jgi:hypothetical protein